ncbi:DUF4296 domain-containing protein [Myroides guanonis]|uniref:DUF4296 domain-containing protein n=1 Tax=Myroides guanonis TaxID=1150112 RepID=UPI000B873D75|nr:DUF4296 domain-containing protein [Myroides guanonis]
MKYFLIIISFLTLLSCEEKHEKPTPFIEEGTMKDIMYDFSLVSAIEGVSAYYTDTVSKINGASVLRKYGIDSLTYVKNSEYYLNLDKGVYLDMQLEVKKRLEEQKAIIDTLVKRENDDKIKLGVVKDSLVLKDSLGVKINSSKVNDLKKAAKGLKLESKLQKLN